MINGLGVLGWGVGGIEAEAAMLGQPIPMLIPQVVGVRLTGRLAAGVTATDLVLSITQMLRRHGVVGKFVEFMGPGASALPVADRATIANMAPEYGATCGLFPVDDAALRYLRETGRSAEHVALVEACTRALGLYWRPDDPEPQYSETLELDLGSVRPSAAGPRRPQDRVDLRDVTVSFAKALPELRKAGAPARSRTNALGLLDGAVVIAAITSCTNTSNPSVMMAAGLLAKKAAERGLKPPKWVKASLAPGSRVVTEYLRAAGLLEPLAQLGFHLVGYGCTTCIGNSGPLLPEVSEAIEKDGLVVAAVLSGNRNFEGRVQQEVRANYLASPPLVVAYALAGSAAVNLTRQPLGIDRDGRPVMLEEIWPSAAEVAEAVNRYVKADLFADCYASIFDGDANWRAIPDSGGALYAWDPNSTYIKRPPYLEGIPLEPPEVVEDIRNAHVLLLLGDSVTTDHISPAGGIRLQSPAGRWLMERGVKPEEFNSYGSRRGHDEVMVRGAFANARLRNRLTPETEGGLTVHIPTDEVMSVYDAAMRYRNEGTPLLIIAGKEYGSGSSRDWAAKGPHLLGVRAVLAESFERIHRSNLIGMGVAPLQFRLGESADVLGLTGRERYSVLGLEAALRGATEAERLVEIVAEQEGVPAIRFRALLRIETPQEADYFRHGGILPYVLRQLVVERT